MQRCLDRRDAYATVKHAAAAGHENVLPFGLTAERDANSRGWYNPAWHYKHEDEIIVRGPSILSSQAISTAAN